MKTVIVFLAINLLASAALANDMKNSFITVTKNTRNLLVATINRPQQIEMIFTNEGEEIKLHQKGSQLKLNTFDAIYLNNGDIITSEKIKDIYYKNDLYAPVQPGNIFSVRPGTEGGGG